MATSLQSLEIPELPETDCAALAAATAALPGLTKVTFHVPTGRRGLPPAFDSARASMVALAELLGSLARHPSVQLLHGDLRFDYSALSVSAAEAAALNQTLLASTDALVHASKSKEVLLDLSISEYMLRHILRHGGCAGSTAATNPRLLDPAIVASSSAGVDNVALATMRAARAVLPMCHSLVFMCEGGCFAAELVPHLTQLQHIEKLRSSIDCAMPAGKQAAQGLLSLTTLRFLSLRVTSRKVPDGCSTTVGDSQGCPKQLEGWARHTLPQLPRLKHLRDLEVSMSIPTCSYVAMVVLQCRGLTALTNLCIAVRKVGRDYVDDVDKQFFREIQQVSGTCARGLRRVGMWDMAHLTQLQKLRIMSADDRHPARCFKAPVGFWAELRRLAQLRVLDLGFEFGVQRLWAVLRDWRECMPLLEVVQVTESVLNKLLQHKTAEEHPCVHESGPHFQVYDVRLQLCDMSHW